MVKIKILMVYVFALAILMVKPVAAREFDINGRPLNIMGYITQNAAFSLTGDYYDTEDGLQSLLTNIFVEAEYLPHKDYRIFLTGKLTADWIYDIKHDDRSWNNRQFSDSRDNMYFDDEYWQILHEAHVTWTPGPFLLRVGKQIVSWGEMDGFRIMDQINPLDQRRGFADVEFENSIIPIWMVRGEYYQSVMKDWLQEWGIQVLFNPNIDFIANQGIKLGNAEGGIWAPNVVLPGTKMGKAYQEIEEPDGSEGFEYGVKLSALAFDTYINLHGFYGRENDPVLLGAAPFMKFSAGPDGTPLLHLVQTGEYPRFKFLGLSMTRDIPFLSWKIPYFAKAHQPVLRFEGYYAFDRTFATDINTMEEFDDVQLGVALDYKIKIPLINKKSTVALTTQFYDRRIRDYPSYGLTGVEDDSNSIIFFAQTSYMNAKLTPSIFYWYDFHNDGSFIKPALSYMLNNDWKYTLAATFMQGQNNEGYDLFDHKDQIFFTVERRFN